METCMFEHPAPEKNLRRAEAYIRENVKDGLEWPWEEEVKLMLNAWERASLKAMMRIRKSTKSSKGGKARA